MNKTPKQKAIDFFKNLLFAAVAALLIKSFLIETSRVPTGSMEKTILIGDFLFVNKFIYGSSSPRNIPFTNVALPYFQLPALADPEKGDIVVFEYPGHRDELFSNEILNYVKRCVGTPGDTLEIRNKVVFVNGEELPIPPKIQYHTRPIPAEISDKRIFPRGSGWNQDNYGPYVIPKTGDVIELNTENIEWWRTIIDREFGKRVVSTKDDKVLINGQPVESYTIQKDYYFMMGDNRDDSEDSRFWGLVPRDLIVGEALMIYWSWNPNIPFTDIFNLLASVRIGRIAKLVY
ncbi:MAG: signal peptidase I [Melioribacteraceae bacterium]|nr:signal peptidase I [Melioribacteraceae bacterium]